MPSPTYSPDRHPLSVPSSLALVIAMMGAGCSDIPAPCSVAPPSVVAVDARSAVDAGVSSDAVERSVPGPHALYVFRASRLTNLVYQLDCLAGVNRCSRAAFEDLWQHTLGFDQADKDAISKWGEIRFAYSGRIEHGDEARAPLPLPQRRRSVPVVMRIASYGAADLADLTSRLSLFIDPTDADATRAIVERFAPRFDTFWALREADLARSIDGYVTLASRADVRAILDSVAEFYQPELVRDARQTFELIARPKHASPDTGEQLDAYALIEVQPGEPPEARFDVVMHELFHAWFAAAAFDRKVALANRFIASTDRSALAAWGLLDEVLATSFGNGVVDRAVAPKDFERRFSEKNGMYFDPNVDAVTKATLAMLESRLAAKKTLWDEDFPAAYLAGVAAAFPKGPLPAAFLTPLVCGYDPSMRAAYEHLTEVTHARPIASKEGLDDRGTRELFGARPMWGSALLVPTAKLGALDGWSPLLLDKPALSTIRREAAKKKPFVFARRREHEGALFVFVAPDDASMQKLEERFVSLPEMRDGVLPE